MQMNDEGKDRRIKIVILLLAAIASIIYLISLKSAYPVFQSTRLVDPLAELHSLFPLYYVAIGMMALLGAACFTFRIKNRGIHILLLLLLAIMLWYTPYYLAEFTWEPDGPRNLGVALQIPEILRGATFPSAGYGAEFPLSYVLDYTLVNATGMDYLGHLHLSPLICLCFFILLCYVFVSKLFNPLTAFITTLLAMIGMHYVIFPIGAHVIGVLLLLTALVFLWRQDTTSKVLAFLLIAAVIICHPISPILLGVFLAAALVANFSRRAIKSQAVVAAMLVVCMAGWLIWPTLSGVVTEEPSIPGTAEITERTEALQRYIFPHNFKTTKRFLLGKAFIYESIYNTNKAIYAVYALLAVTAVGFVLHRTRLQQKGVRAFLSKLGGLTRAEIFMAISALMLILLAILLGESDHVLIERGLTFTILAISGLIASIVIRVYESAKARTRRPIACAVAVILLFLTLSFPMISYSIDAYTSFPVSEEAGLKFLANHTPLDKKILATTSTGQMALYRPHIAPPVGLRSPSSLERGDVFAFRITGYYYAAMRHDLSFEDNWFTRYVSVVNTNSEFNSIYSNPTTSVFIKVRQ